MDFVCCDFLVEVRVFFAFNLLLALLRSCDGLFADLVVYLLSFCAVLDFPVTLVFLEACFDFDSSSLSGVGCAVCEVGAFRLLDAYMRRNIY